MEVSTMKNVIVALLVVHGLIHSLGFAEAWGLAELEGASAAPTNLVSLEAGSAGVKILGLIWLVALVAFLGAALLLLAGNPTWRSIALVASLISMVPIALWWQDSPAGAVANALVLAAVWFAPRFEGVPV
jgi:hypothetical protein